MQKESCMKRQFEKYHIISIKILINKLKALLKKHLNAVPSQTMSKNLKSQDGANHPKKVRCWFFYTFINVAAVQLLKEKDDIVTVLPKYANIRNGQQSNN